MDSPGALDFDRLIAVFRKAAAALRDASVDAALAGGLGVWARGGAKPRDDVDFVVRPEDAERGLAALVDAGFRAHDETPEDWLVQAWHDDVLVDLIHRLAGEPVDDALFERAGVVPLEALDVKVLSATDLVVAQVRILSETKSDLGQPLEPARALREQVDWDDVARRTEGNPFATAFLVLCEELGVKPA